MLALESFVATVETMAAAANCSYLVGEDVKQKSTYKKLVLVLDNLNELYIGIYAERMWAGTGHEARAFSILPLGDTSGILPASLASMSTALQDPLGSFTVFESVEIYAAGKGFCLLHEEWVKLKNCHHCGKCGHICPNCSKWKALSHNR